MKKSYRKKPPKRKRRTIAELMAAFEVLMGEVRQTRSQMMAINEEIAYLQRERDRWRAHAIGNYEALRNAREPKPPDADR